MIEKEAGVPKKASLRELTEPAVLLELLLNNITCKTFLLYARFILDSEKRKPFGFALLRRFARTVFISPTVKTVFLSVY